MFDAHFLPRYFPQLNVLQTDHTNVSNYTSDLLETEKLEGDKEFNIKWSAASLYAGNISF